MILIIIAILLAIVVAIFASKFPEDVSGSFIVVAAMLTISGIFFPVSGYSERILQTEYELMPLIEGTNVYVLSTDKENVICKYANNNEGNEISAITEYDNSVKLEIADKGTQPVLKIYSRKPKRTWWTFALLGNKVETVICVPEANLIE